MRKKIKVDTIIFDFDSTILRGELLEILANHKLECHPGKNEILRKIIEITNMGMEGKISFGESLRRRLDTLELDEKTFKDALPQIITMINSEYLELIEKVRNKKRYVISGGYTNIIRGLDYLLDIPASQIHAIKLNFKDGKLVGFDQDSPLIESNGKAVVAQSIKNKGVSMMVGDGMTDYMVKELGGADYFTAYTGVVRRESVCDRADFVINNLSDLSEIIE